MNFAYQMRFGCYRGEGVIDHTSALESVRIIFFQSHGRLK